MTVDVRANVDVNYTLLNHHRAIFRWRPFLAQIVTRRTLGTHASKSRAHTWASRAANQDARRVIDRTAV